MTKVAVILSGCGYLDGAEIREAVLTLLYLDQAGASFECFAPDVEAEEINHLTGDPTGKKRNVLVEAARIARGDVKPLSEAKATDFDALILPGGFGAAKVLSDFAEKGAEATVLPELESLIKDFNAQKKPIGAICIAPATLVAAIGKDVHPAVTIGDDAGASQAIEAMGGKHEAHGNTSEATFDETNRIATCPAYMLDQGVANVAAGIEKVVNKVVELARQQKAAA